MFARRGLRALAPLILLTTILPIGATPVSADVGATIPGDQADLDIDRTTVRTFGFRP